jgi:hypothetical protein
VQIEDRPERHQHEGLAHKVVGALDLLVHHPLQAVRTMRLRRVASSSSEDSSEEREGEEAAALEAGERTRLGEGTSSSGKGASDGMMMNGRAGSFRKGQVVPVTAEAAGETGAEPEGSKGGGRGPGSASGGGRQPVDSPARGSPGQQAVPGDLAVLRFNSSET